MEMFVTHLYNKSLVLFYANFFVEIIRQDDCKSVKAYIYAAFIPKYVQQKYLFGKTYRLLSFTYFSYLNV